MASLRNGLASVATYVGARATSARTYLGTVNWARGARVVGIAAILAGSALGISKCGSCRSCYSGTTSESDNGYSPKKGKGSHKGGKQEKSSRHPKASLDSRVESIRIAEEDSHSQDHYRTGQEYETTLPNHYIETH